MDSNWSPSPHEQLETFGLLKPVAEVAKGLLMVAGIQLLQGLPVVGIVAGIVVWMQQRHWQVFVVVVV